MKQRKYVVDLVKAAFLVLLVKVMCTYSLIVPWSSFADDLCIAFAICVMLAKLCTLTLPLGKLLALGCMSAFALYTCVSMQMYDLLVTTIAICLLVNEDLEEYITLLLKAQSAILIFHIVVSGILSLSGSPDRFWFVADDRLRFNGGFRHSNVLSCCILSCMLMFVWKRFRRITANQFACLFCITALTYLMSRSRTGLLLNLLLLLITILSQGNTSKLLEKIIDPLLVLLFPGLSAGLFLAQKQFVAGNRIALLLDDLLTTRIKLGAYAYMRSGATFLPRYLDYVTSGVNVWTPEWNISIFTFDCLYSYLFMQMGTIWIGIITVLLAIVCKRLDFRNKLFFLFWVLFAVVEVHGLNCFTFFPLLLLSALISEKGADDHPTCKN